MSEQLECEQLECHQLECEQLECEQLECEQLECEQLECEQLECEQLECHQLCVNEDVWSLVICRDMSWYVSKVTTTTLTHEFSKVTRVGDSKIADIEGITRFCG